MTAMSEMFWTFCITSGIGLIITVMKMAYKSKCKECSCFCIKVIRDTDLEEKELEFQVKNGLPPIMNTDFLQQIQQSENASSPKSFRKGKQNNGIYKQNSINEKV